MNCVKQDYPESVQALGLSVPIILDLLREARRRCTDLTDNCGICGLLIAIKAFLQNYIDQYKIVLRQIDRSKGVEEDWSMFQICLTVLQHIGDIIMIVQLFEKELVLVVLNVMKNHIDVESKYVFLTTSGQKQYENLIKDVKEGNDLSLLEITHNELQRICKDIHHTTYQVVIAPITVQLDQVQSAKAWNDQEIQLPSNDLPDYSFAPQEYITQVLRFISVLPTPDIGLALFSEFSELFLQV